MTTQTAAPVLSTADSHVLEDDNLRVPDSAFATLSDDDLEAIFEIRRTAEEILSRGCHHVALQFPDDMLQYSPRVSESLSRALDDSLKHARNPLPTITKSIEQMTLDGPDAARGSKHKLTILADTSYGSCCVDEIAAEHVDAELMVHYGRTCLSPTSRLPIIYIYTIKPLDIDATIESFKPTFPDLGSMVVLLADVPYHSHTQAISSRLQSVGYSNVFTPSLIHQPASPLPNRSLPPGCDDDPSLLKNYSVFHIGDPPPALLLNLSSRVSSIRICSVDGLSGSVTSTVEASTARSLGRRYGLVTRLSSAAIFGILINTLSVKNYLDVVQQVKDMITASGKKYYTFVVGKVNAAKVANFSEIDGWVVIGCWESSLIESKDFWKPIITPFELRLALMHESERLWTGEWDSNFQLVLDQAKHATAIEDSDKAEPGPNDDHDNNDDDESISDGDEESEPPVYDLRTGRYVSHSRPLGRRRQVKSAATTTGDKDSVKPVATHSTSLVKRADQHVARIGGEASPAAEFLRQQRTWQGLGSDYHDDEAAEVAYQYDEDGKRVGAAMEQGRGGIARGYAVGEEKRT